MFFFLHLKKKITAGIFVAMYGWYDNMQSRFEGSPPLLPAAEPFALINMGTV